MATRKYYKDIELFGKEIIDSLNPNDTGLWFTQATSATPDMFGAVGAVKGLGVDSLGHVIVTSAVIAGAFNGLSIDSTGQVELGNEVGDTDAQLVNDRQIPQNGFDIDFIRGAGKFIMSETATSGKTWFRSDKGGNGETRLLIDPIPDGGADMNSRVGFFRSVNNSGILGEQSELRIYRSNGTDNVQTIIGANRDTLFNMYEGDFSIGVPFGVGGVIPNSPTGKNAKVYIRMDNEDTVIDSGLDDYSGLVVSRLDGNSPKEDCSTATPLGYDNATGLVVPIEKSKVVYDIMLSGIGVTLPLTVNGNNNFFGDVIDQSYTNTTGCRVKVTSRYNAPLTRMYHKGDQLFDGTQLAGRYTIVSALYVEVNSVFKTAGSCGSNAIFCELGQRYHLELGGQASDTTILEPGDTIRVYDRQLGFTQDFSNTSVRCDFHRLELRVETI